jgi:hypothetical protein
LVCFGILLEFKENNEEGEWDEISVSSQKSVKFDNLILIDFNPKVRSAFL